MTTLPTIPDAEALAAARRIARRHGPFRCPVGLILPRGELRSECQRHALRDWLTENEPENPEAALLCAWLAGRKITPWPQKRRNTKGLTP